MLHPSRYRIFTFGKLRKGWIQDALALYLKRLPGLTITELKDSNPQREAEAIQSSLRNNEKLIALSEEGEALTSIIFAKRLQLLGSQRLVFVIGGPNGLAPEFKHSADLCLSLSPLTFPHQIALLLLVEQLYRTQSIIQGTSYHRS